MSGFGKSIVVACALVVTGAARAEPVDMSRLTCADFGQIGDNEQIFVLAWFNGYLNGLSGNTRLDPAEFLTNVEKMKAYCAANGAITVVQAVPRALNPQPDATDKTGTVAPPAPPPPATTTVPATPAPAAPRKPTPQP